MLDETGIILQILNIFAMRPCKSTYARPVPGAYVPYVVVLTTNGLYSVF